MDSGTAGAAGTASNPKDSLREKPDTVDDDGIAGQPEQAKNDTAVKYIKNRKFGDNYPADRIVDALLCPERENPDCQPYERVHIRIVPARKAILHNWDSASAGKIRGQVVAKFVDVDPVKAYPLLGLKKGDSVYLWVGTTVNGRAARLLRFADFEGGHATDTGIPVKWNLCPKATHKSDPSAVHIVAPETCPGAFVAEGDVFLPKNAVWVSCSAGCCEVEVGGYKKSNTSRAAATKKRSGQP